MSVGSASILSHADYASRREEQGSDGYTAGGEIYSSIPRGQPHAAGLHKPRSTAMLRVSQKAFTVPHRLTAGAAPSPMLLAAAAHPPGPLTCSSWRLRCRAGAASASRSHSPSGGGGVGGGGVGGSSSAAEPMALPRPAGPQLPAITAGAGPSRGTGRCRRERGGGPWQRQECGT